MGIGDLTFFSFLFLFWSWIILVVGYVYSALGLSPTGDVWGLGISAPTANRSHW